MSVEVGYLCVGGIELIHDARTLSYLYRGLAGAHIAASVGVTTSGAVSGIIEAPYSDVYSDDYGAPFTVDCADGFAPPCLDCACTALTLIETFDDPATDDAPWFQASVPHSAEFLGATAVAMDLLPATAQTQQPRTRFGGTPSSQRLLPRVMQVTARLFAATPAGLEWGKRWFTDVLAGACGSGVDATFLPYCPIDGQDPDDVYRLLADTILIDGPTWGNIGSFDGFRAIEARFQLASSAPWLMGVPTTCQTGTLAAGASRSCLIETADWGGGQAIRLTMSGAMNGVTVRAVPLAADQPCPVVGTGMACSEFTIQGTQNGDVLLVDSARRAALLTDISSKNDVSAIPYLDFDGPFSWIEAPPCTRLCVTVTNHGAGIANVTLETVLQEL